MLYFLLTIIAIGVLLCSEGGRRLLDWLAMLALIVGGLYLAFWIIVIAISFFTSDTGHDILGILVFIIVVLTGNYLIKTFGNKITNKYPKIIPFWQKYGEKIINNILIVYILSMLLLIVFYSLK